MKKCIKQVKKGFAVLLAVIMVAAVAPLGVMADVVWQGEGWHSRAVAISNVVNAEEPVVMMNAVLTEQEQEFLENFAEFFGIENRNTAINWIHSLYRLQVSAPAEVVINGGGIPQLYFHGFWYEDLRTINNLQTERTYYEDGGAYYYFGTFIVPGSSILMPTEARVGDVLIFALRYRASAEFDVFAIELVGDGTPTTQPTPTPDTNAPNLDQASNWAHDGINRAYELGLIPIALQSNYTQNTTRAEFAAFAVALYETVTGRTITERAAFNDTTDINVQKMGGLGVVTGVGGGNFNPNGTITREQAAVLVARLAYAIGQPLPPSAPTFADNNSISSWAVDGVGQMQASGIMGGVGNNNFAPRGQYTREQSIISMLRLFDILD